MSHGGTVRPFELKPCPFVAGLILMKSQGWQQTTGLPIESLQGGELDVAELARGLMKLGIIAPWQMNILEAGDGW